MINNKEKFLNAMKDIALKVSEENHKNQISYIERAFIELLYMIENTSIDIMKDGDCINGDCHLYKEFKIKETEHG
jgi:hypothetical protein